MKDRSKSGTRGNVAVKHLRPFSSTSIFGGIAGLIGITALMMWTGDASSLLTYNTILTVAIAAIALNLLLGTAGQPSLATPAFLTIGGFTTGICTQHGIPFPCDLLIAAAVAAVVGALTGLPALRLRGLYLALSSIAAYYVVNYVATLYQDHHVGISGFVIPSWFLAKGLTGQQQYWAVVLCGATALAMLVCGRLSAGRTGRALRIIRDAESAAPAFGIRPRDYKLGAYVVSAVMTAIAGVLGARLLGGASVDTYTFNLAITYILVLLIGGFDSVNGCVAGAALVTLLPSWTEHLANRVVSGANAAVDGSGIALIIYGGVIVLLVSRWPGGIAGAARRLWAWLRRRYQDVQGGLSVAKGTRRAVVTADDHVEEVYSGPD